MRLFKIFAAAGLLIASLGVSTVANAQPQRDDRHYQSDRGRDRGNDGRGSYRNQRHDRGNHNGWSKKRQHQRCHTEWRRGHRVRICR
jgi:Ni/Co efflux regulator RcnB